MNESELKTNGGQEYLVVYYSNERRDWNESIERALNRHKIDKPITVLCVPKKCAHAHTNST